MCSFDYHLRQAQKCCEDDVLWMISYYYSSMKKLCNKYPVRDKEDMLAYLIACFWADLLQFMIYEDKSDISLIESGEGER